MIKSVADYAKIGLKTSYFSVKSVEKLKKEKSRLENIINTPIEFSRQHYLRLTIPETYQNLLDLDLKEDYTMGYSNFAGFRASTCTPFYFYDLDFEIQTPLKLFPCAISAVTLKEHLQLSNEESLTRILDMKEAVMNVNGTFISVSQNQTFSENAHWRGWTDIYKKMVLK